MSDLKLFDHLARKCTDSLRGYLDRNPKLDEKIYRARLAYELEVIKQAGYSEYFLIVEDYISRAREIGGLTGPGRGSSAASIVTFLLGITRVLDPLQYPDLMFERFLTPGRPDPPDIDVDFDFESAEWVYEYCRRKYGEDRVAKIGTFSQMGVRQALADVGRVLGIPYEEVNRVSGIFKDFRPDEDEVRDDNRAMFGLEEIAKLNPELVALRDKSELHKQWFSQADKLQGVKRNASQHASAIAIADRAFGELGVPLMMSTPAGKGPVITTQLDMDDLAKLGIIKFDILKLSSLNVIHMTERLVGNDFDIEEVPLDDPKTYASLCRGDNLAVFQISASKVKGVCKVVKPTCLADIAAIITIIRPGLVAKDKETGLTMEELYKARRVGDLPVTYRFPFLEEILSSTYGVMIYQESCVKLLWAAGFTPLEADKLRKVLSKKQRSKAKEFEPAFLAKAQENLGLSIEDAQWLWDLIEEFSGYAFVASHAYAYGLIAYWTAYLKTHYPAQFLTASLTIQNQKATKASKILIPKLLEDASQMGRSIPILSPSVNSSDASFSLEADPENKLGIRFGLDGIKHVGGLSQAIIDERRERGDFRSLEELDARMTARLATRPNKRALESLAYAGALDEFFSHRSEALWSVTYARTDTRKGKLKLEEEGWKPERAAVLAKAQAQLCSDYFFEKSNQVVLGREVDNFFEHALRDKVTIGGRVRLVKLDRKSKAGHAYHQITLQTQWGDVGISFFPPRQEDPTTWLLAIKEKLFNGSIILVTGQVRSERDMFGNRIMLPRKELRSE